MPNIKSAIKRVHVTKIKTLRNASLKSALKTSIKKFESATKSSKEEAQVALVNAIKSIDKAVVKGILHKNAAARRKSRLTKKFNGIA